MTTADEELVPIRAYARLLTMLGEQLIKNDRIALLELIKNSYDADATNVQIRFDNFGPLMETRADSRIVITDDGDGMSSSTVKEHWLNPATNIKDRRKRSGATKTNGGRVIQGEKGIGRFAMFKLGSAVTMTTRSRDEPGAEIVATLDISFLDDQDEALETDAKVAQYLDEVTARITQREPETFVGGSDLGPHGTELIISNLRSKWSHTSLIAVHESVLRLRPLSGLLTGRAGEDPLGFEITYSLNSEAPDFLTNPETLLDSLIPRAVIRVVGNYTQATNTFDLDVNDNPRTVSLASAEIRGLQLYKKFVSDNQELHKFECGDFAYEFMIFDLRPSAEVQFQLNKVDKDLIKDHRIYLYRDGVRVLPYGDADDDWLQLDVIRGTMGANRVLSNDQTIGFVYISQEGNPGLRDKTNREGLIDSGSAYSDFIHLMQLLINYLRKGDFSRYLSESRARIEAEDRRKTVTIPSRIDVVRESLATIPAARKAFDDFADAYRSERRVMQERIDRTEDLAGVGLSVETASHDIIASANQAYKDSIVVTEQIGHELGTGHLIARRSRSLSEALSFILSRLQDVQGLFVSSRQRPQNLNLAQYVRKIENIYARTLREANIQVQYQGDPRIEALTHEATLLQIFLNLMDNSVYWLRASRISPGIITVTIDADGRQLIFEDNGPGVLLLDVPYIFDPFFSGRGEAGRGLGLYISRQVARRDGLDLHLVHDQLERASAADHVPARFAIKVPN